MILLLAITTNNVQNNSLCVHVKLTILGVQYFSVNVYTVFSKKIGHSIMNNL